MKSLFDKAIVSYVEMLKIHIDTKTTDPVFHRITEEFYELMFEVAHSIGEKYVDLDGKLDATTLEGKKLKALMLMKEMKESIEKFQSEEPHTLGTEDLLGSLTNDLEGAIGNAKGFVAGRGR